MGLPALVASQRPWDRLFIVDSESGYSLYQQFRGLALHTRRNGPLQSLISTTTTVPGGLVLHNPSHSQPAHEMMRRETHNQVMTIGTFQSLDFDQRVLLTMSAFLVEPSQPARDLAHTPQHPKLLVGISDDSEASFNAPVENFHAYQTRQIAVACFLDTVTNFRPEASDSSGSNENTEIGRSCDTLMIYDFERFTAPSDPAARNRLLSVALLPAGYVPSDVTAGESRHSKGWSPLESFSMDEIVSSQNDEDDLQVTTLQRLC